MAYHVQLLEMQSFTVFFFVVFFTYTTVNTPACVSHSEKCRVNFSHSSWTQCPQRTVGIGSGDTGLSDLFMEVSGIWKTTHLVHKFTVDM